jgi:uncharacterized protein YcbK (DUF882 family)
MFERGVHLHKQTEIITRREFLKTSSALCLGAILLPESLFSQTVVNGSLKPKKEKSLQFFNINSKEFLDVTYFKNGAYVESALHDINKIMADKRSGGIANINLALIETLHSIHSLSGSKEPIELICGYRSPKTNSKLTHAKKGVAKNSYHTLGKAADIRMDGISLAGMHEIAHSLNAGGVGYYPRSGFVHIDVGPVRTWRG